MTEVMFDYPKVVRIVVPGPPSGPVANQAFAVNFEEAVPRTITERFEEQANIRDFDAKGDGIADDAPAIQRALDAAGSSINVYLPAGIYRCATPIISRVAAFCIRGEGPRTRIIWDNTTDWLFSFGLEDGSGAAMVRGYFAEFEVKQLNAPTAGGFFKMDRLAQPIFLNVRTDDAFVHYQCTGTTRTLWIGCYGYGSTLWPTATAVPGSCVLKLREYAMPGGTYQHCVNIKLLGCEFSGNSAVNRSYDHIIDADGFDGLFIEPTTYLGHSVNTVVYVQPLRPETVFANFKSDAFVDATPGCGYEFHEASDGFHTGTANTVYIGGQISGMAKDGIKLNIANLERVKISAIIKSCTGFGLRVANGSHIDASGSLFDNNVSGDVRLEKGSWFSMAGGQCFSVTSNHFQVINDFSFVNVQGVLCRNAIGNDVLRTTTDRHTIFRLMTDKPAVIASADAIVIPFGQDVYEITGNTDIHAISEGSSSAFGRIVTLKFSGVLAMKAGAFLGMIAGLSPRIFRTGDVATLVCIDGSTFWLQGQLRTPVVLDIDGQSLSKGDVEKIYSNEGALAQTDFTLPFADTVDANLGFSFLNKTSFGLRIIAAAGDRIIVNEGTSALAGRIDSVVPNSFVTLKAINATEWLALGERGTWTVT